MADKYEYKKFEYDKPWDAEGKYNTFTPGTDTTTAMTNKTNAEKAYSDFVEKGYAYANQQMLNDYMSKYQGRDPFSYDFNTDAMYQQYKDKYMKQGKMAMQDTMGQAAALTGGYGNSYASTVGNQAYQASLENLNDIIPQLYEMAYARYNQEGQDMLNNISLLQGERGFDYGVWGDKANMLQGDRGYHQSEANNLWNRDYGVWNDNRAFDRGVYESDRNLTIGTNARDLKAIREKAATFTNNGDLAAYLANQGLDTDTQKMLMNEYATPNRKSFDTRTWENTNKGGMNWFGGIDNNAKYIDEYGDTYTGKQIYNELIKAGMDKTAAYDYLRKLQKDTGATKD